ncbi:unnamed protein product [Rhizoctonia solani]|uniref:Uncharacterized protein n=1 Tax=Rhizoctonia solani TaxID=456999 RepID=A0A8H3DZ46_9AGAM|nr:unnamed protein product [Rhizoctonia solani]
MESNSQSPSTNASVFAPHPGPDWTNQPRKPGGSPPASTSAAPLPFPRTMNLVYNEHLIEGIPVRSRDSLIAVGKRLACKLVATVLQAWGIYPESASLENIVPAFESELEGGTQLDQTFYDAVAKAVGERLAQCERRVQVAYPAQCRLAPRPDRTSTDLLATLAALGTQAHELRI